MEHAKTVEAKATPKVKQAVKDGELSVKKAAEIAQLPPKEQAKVVQEKAAPKVSSLQPSASLASHGSGAGLGAEAVALGIVCVVKLSVHHR